MSRSQARSTPRVALVLLKPHYKSLFTPQPLVYYSQHLSAADSSLRRYIEGINSLAYTSRYMEGCRKMNKRPREEDSEDIARKNQVVDLTDSPPPSPNANASDASFALQLQRKEREEAEAASLALARH